MTDGYKMEVAEEEGRRRGGGWGGTSCEALSRAALVISKSVVTLSQSGVIFSKKMSHSAVLSGSSTLRETGDYGRRGSTKGERKKVRTA